MNPPVAATFDIQNALKLLDASALAYGPTPPREAAVLNSRGGDTRALVLTGPADGIVAFRGTANIRNWLTDLECDLKPWQSTRARVHAGFLAAWRSVRNEVIEAVENFGPERRIWLTGHSLGGALAMLGAFDLKREVFNARRISGCYTFGQPRVGNCDFRDWFDAILRDQTFRVVHSDDIVARVPWLLGAYRHAGHEIFFPSPNKLNFDFASPGYSVNPSLWPKLLCDISGLIRAWTHGADALLCDHFVRSYINLLSRAPAVRAAAFTSTTHN